MADILHRIPISAPGAKILPLITTSDGFRAWWTDDVEAKPEKGTIDRFRFHGGAVEFPFRVDEVSPSRVSMTCVEGPKVPAEWVGTRLAFDLLPAEAGGTDLRFAHSNWREADSNYMICNTTWGELMHRLRDAAEGKPRGPYFERPYESAR
jgi:uncharacterized protein YndB with AHSA1/START domain